MATREQTLARGTYFGERDVEKRVYDALVGDGIAHHREMELCRELAALAGSMVPAAKLERHRYRRNADRGGAGLRSSCQRARRTPTTLARCVSRSITRLSWPRSVTSHRQAHVGHLLTLAGPRAQPRHVHLLAGDHGCDIPQKTGPVVGAELQSHRIGVFARLFPGYIDDPGAILDPQAQHVGAVTAMDADAAPAGDVPQDRLRRHRLATSRDLGEQIADAADTNVAVAGRARPLARLYAAAPEVSPVARPAGRRRAGPGSRRRRRCRPADRRNACSCSGPPAWRDPARRRRSVSAHD